MQPTPSPRSTSEAPEFFFTTPLDFFATVTDHTPSGTVTGFQLPLARSKNDSARRRGRIVARTSISCPIQAASQHWPRSACLSFFMRATVASTPAASHSSNGPISQLKPKLHRAIDSHYRVRNFGNAIGSISPKIR